MVLFASLILDVTWFFFSESYTRRAAARLLLTAGRAAVDRCLLAAGPTAANPHSVATLKLN